MITINEVVVNAITNIINDFQANPSRFWNERDIHWSLFHYLKQRQASGEAYPTQLIRAEFPTLKVFQGSKPARGHYDLVIINAESNNNPEIQNMEAQTPWQKYLELIKLDIAIEIKLWLNRLQKQTMEERVDWDIQKLTDKPNNIQNAYFLNFVQLDFQRGHNRLFYQQLRKYLIAQRKNQLSILCIPGDCNNQPNFKDNWL